MKSIVVIGLGFFLGACSLLVETPDPVEDIDTRVKATLTKVAYLERQESNRATESAPQTATIAPTVTDTPQPSPTSTLIPTDTLTPTLTLSPTPLHVLIPSGPTGRTTFVTDIITVGMAKDKTAIGDNYAWSKLERPYTAETMEYRDDLDIMRVEMQVRDPWVYITFILIGDLPNEGDAHYAVELDLDKEGRGEVLVMASLPTDKEWTTHGVRVLEDRNGDIGGLFPLYEEAPQENQDGYEFEIFADGVGEDRDLAWVRRDPEHANRLQLAFKRTLIGSRGMLWNAWTDAGVQDPGMFDFNDHISFEDAGSPHKGNYRYPVKAVALVDSTCRSWYGFIPTGEEPGLCYTGEGSDKEAGMGYCVANLAAPGCKSACYRTCPDGETCRPCQLP